MSHIAASCWVDGLSVISRYFAPLKESSQEQITECCNISNMTKYTADAGSQ